MKIKRQWFMVALALVVLLASAHRLFGQADQGTITGEVLDQTGAVVSNASVTLTNVDLNQVSQAKTDGAGVFTFPPVKIGNYKITAAAAGFETTTQTNLKLNIQQRLSVVLILKPGAAAETITVTTEAPLMQTEDVSVGQTMDTETINSVPLNGRNWVYIAQLSAGTAVADGARGGGKGDFEANGQRAEENNFVLDGVDNNANVVDFYNGASFSVNPPPDALAEFKVQTSNYSAEFGHSAGAAIIASIKSGSNSFHGSLWEYVRNTAFDIHDWEYASKTAVDGLQAVPAYHDNQFGATLGGPIWKNKLFFFGDFQSTRIAMAETTTETVPTANMRQGNFSELLNTSLTSDGNAHQLYHQASGSAAAAYANNCLVTSNACTFTSSSFSAPTLNAEALKLLNYFPSPNANGSKVYNNYVVQRPITDNTFQWDARMDYTIGSRDTAYSRYSYSNEVGMYTPPLGSILDGGSFGDTGKQKDYAANFMASETHLFSDTFTNEFRFGFNYLHTGFQHENAGNLGFAASIGVNGIPTEPLNGGLPWVNTYYNGSSSAMSGFGSPTWSTTDEHENVYQIIDNVTKILGNHTLKAGLSFINVRFSTLQPQDARGTYNYTGAFTSNVVGGTGVNNTGWGVADFLLDQQHDAALSNEVTNGDQRSNWAFYVQDDWRLSRKLTVNAGLRWEYFQPYQDVGGYQAAFVPDPSTFSFSSTSACTNPSILSTTGCGSGKAKYLIPSEAWTYAQSVMNSSKYSPNYNTVLGYDNISTVETSNPHLLTAQKTNFAPRLGLSYSLDPKTTLRAGFGIFYGGLESVGYWPNLGENYPFQFTGTFTPSACGSTSCSTDGISLNSGFSSIIANGFASNTTGLTMRGAEAKPKTPYTESWNLAVERGLSNDMVVTASYVGNTGRHILTNVDANGQLAAVAHGQGSNNQRPFPDAGGSANVVDQGSSEYSALQTKLEKRMSHGYNLLATYTWSHSIDDIDTPLGSSGDTGDVNFNLVPLHFDRSQSPWDTRHRLTFNTLYELPFGKGRTYLNHSAVLDEIVGGWSVNAMFTAQSGNFFTVWPNSVTTPDNIGARAEQIGNPYAGGGSAPSNNSSISCPTSVKNASHWFNPCAFQNPWNSSSTGDHPLTKGTYLTGYNNPAILGYVGGRRNQIAGPGYQRVNASLFKSFKIYHEQKLDFRTDVFNLFNSPALGNPNDTNIDGNGGRITGTRSLQNHAPDSRFFQLSLRYAF
jgi:hypothetical protein